jgi:hypothetical protein
LNRKFKVDKPNTVWVGDITYVWTNEGVIIQTPTLKFLLLWDKARMRGIKLGNQSDPLATGSLGTGNPARL